VWRHPPRPWGAVGGRPQWRRLLLCEPSLEPARLSRQQQIAVSDSAIERARSHNRWRARHPRAQRDSCSPLRTFSFRDQRPTGNSLGAIRLIGVRAIEAPAPVYRLYGFRSARLERWRRIDGVRTSPRAQALCANRTCSVAEVSSRNTSVDKARKRACGPSMDAVDTCFQ
jgi:hypothetical protein